MHFQQFGMRVNHQEEHVATKRAAYSTWIRNHGLFGQDQGYRGDTCTGSGLLFHKTSLIALQMGLSGASLIALQMGLSGALL